MRTPRVLVVCGALAFAACSMPLQHDLNEEDANEISVLLEAHGISSVKDKEGEGKEARYIISVPKGSIAAAAKLLKENSLPRPMAAGLAIFKQTKGMIPTQTEERAMFIEALGGETSNALNRIPGVLEARVIVMIPEVTDLTQPELRAKPSASVLLKYIGEKQPVLPVDVQQFVARAVPELAPENVKVLMIQSAAITSNAEENEAQQVTSLGVRVSRAEMWKFNALVAIPTTLFLLVTVLLGWVLVRKPPAKNGTSSRRPKPPDA